jgi:hypothetical protein
LLSDRWGWICAAFVAEGWEDAALKWNLWRRDLIWRGACFSDTTIPATHLSPIDISQIKYNHLNALQPYCIF